MQPSSLVFVAIVAMWAAYLLPQWVRRRDALGASRADDRHSDRLRVLSRRRRRSGGPSTAPLLPDVVISASVPLEPTPAPKPAKPVVEAKRVAEPKPVVRSAARRRLRVLIGLLLLTGGALGADRLLPLTVWNWVSGAAGALVLLYLAALVVAGRRRAVRAAQQARVLRSRTRRVQVPARPLSAPAQCVPIEPVVATELFDVDQVVGTGRAAASAADSRAHRAPVTAVADDGTWVPVSVPPPTYTLKATAPRSQPRPLELPMAAERAAEAAGAADVADIADVSFGDTFDLDEVLARRRAVNG